MRRGIPVLVLKYITGEFAKTLVLTLGVVTAMWVFVSALQNMRHQIMGPREFLLMIPLLSVITMAYTLPMAVLFGASISYGRMSFENEIRAMEWNGIHMGWVTLPAVIIAAATSCLALYLNSEIVPATKTRLDGLFRSNLPDTIKRQLVKAAQEGQSINISHMTLALKSFDPETSVMKGVTVIQAEGGKEGGRVLRRIDANSARIVSGKQPGAVLLTPDSKQPGQKHHYTTFVFEGGRVTEFDRNYGGMTITGVAPPIAFDLSEDSKRPPDPDNMQLLDLIAYARKAGTASDRRLAWTEVCERIALGTSPFFFALLAVPMALVVRWKHSLAAFLPCMLVIMGIWFPLLMWGKVQGRAGNLDPMYGMFMGDAALLLISAGLMTWISRR